jgi:hypothetical protein
MGVLFLVSTALQFNDPDPLGWMAIYAAAGVACLLPRGRSVRLWLAAVTALAACIWAGSLAPRTLPDLVLSDLVKKMEDKTPQIELGREMLGLVILAVVLSCVAIAEWRRRADD